MPKVVDKEKRKEELALIALDVFAELGFDGASINSIAQAAGVAKGTIYEYFESKEDLIFHAIMAWMHSMENDALPSDIQEISPEEQLRALVRTAVDTFTSDPRSVRLMTSMINLALTNEAFLSRYDIIHESFQGMRRAIRDILLRGISEGSFRPEIAKDADAIATNLFAYLDGIYLHYIVSNRRINMTEHIEFYMDELLRDLKPQTSGKDAK